MVPRRFDEASYALETVNARPKLHASDGEGMLKGRIYIKTCSVWIKARNIDEARRSVECAGVFVWCVDVYSGRTWLCGDD